MTYEEILHNGNLCAAYFKTVMCACNSSAHFIMNHAHDLIKKHPKYRHEAKRAFRQAAAAMDRYRQGLIACSAPRFFHLNDLAPDVRKRFAADATDADYFDYWESIGAQGYEKGKRFIYSMQNKYRKSLEAHKVKDADTVAWLFAAMAVLATAVRIYESAVRKSVEAFGLKRNTVVVNFHHFSLQGVADAWSKALHVINIVESYKLDPDEDRDIELGLTQLAETWCDPDVVFGAAAEATADFPEIFASKRQMQKSVNALYELKNESEEEIKQAKIEKMKERIRHEKRGRQEPCKACS